MTETPGKLQSITLPWRDEAPWSSDMATGHVRDNLWNWLIIDGRLHAETLLCAIGSLAGYAAQMTIWTDYVNIGRPIPPNGFVSIDTKSGQRFYFGDLLNGYLLPRANNDFPIWIFVAGAAVTCGVPQNELPDINSFFGRAASTIGTPEFDILTVPEQHLPHMTPRQNVEAFWLSISKLMTMATNPQTRQPLPAPKPEYWPIIFGLVAQQYIIKAKDILDPKLAVHIVMQSAIIASKYDSKELKFRPAH